MDQWLRDILNVMSTNVPVVMMIVAGAFGFALFVAAGRRWQLGRQEQIWLEHRLFVSKRPKSLRFAPFLPSQRDRRVHPRRVGNPVAIIIYDDTDSHTIGDGRVVDRSLGGVCISSQHRLDVGARFQIRLLTQRNQLPGIPVEVRSVRPEPMAWRIGCRFLRRPSWSVSMHLR